MKLFFETADFSEIRSAVSGLIPFVPTDEQIMAAISGDTQLVGAAFMWGWGDSAVRAGLCEALVGLLSAPGNDHG